MKILLFRLVFFQKRRGSFRLRYRDHQLDAAHCIGKNRICCNGVLIFQPAIDAVFLEPAHYNIGLNVIDEGIEQNKIHSASILIKE